MATTREEQIRAQAKSIMDNFFAALRAADVKSDEIGVARNNQTRKPSKKDSDESFRDAILANAPNKDIDYIVAERKSW